MGEIRKAKPVAADGTLPDHGQGERKYYELRIDMDFRGAPMRVWTNEKEMREGFRPDAKQPFRGLQLREPPRIAFDRGRRRGLRFRDADAILLGFWLVSDRMKVLLEGLDPEAFAFAKAEVDYGNFDEPGPGFWFCDIVRMLDCIDEERSKLTFYDHVPFKAYDELINVKMRPEAVAGAHAFRLQHATTRQIVDDIFVRAVSEQKMTGFRFVAIQWP